ncbi:hypothetical protein BKA64DRAFT_689201 [Cadophora sp. MPI-SDFR-AT-0126]|nr:hypothetical protein BKA64DRAFT_689201 [Leotiomycetes sp. MPI-SDFR-AT-0126]
MLPPASICTRLQPLVSCTLTLADYLEGGISQSEAQDLIDACPTLLQSQKDIQSLCQLRQAVAGFEPFCAPEPYVPSNSTMNCPTGKCNSTGSVDVIEYVTVVTCDICQTSLGAVYTPAVVPCGICVGGSATVQPPHLAGCPTCAGGSTRIPPHYEVPCMTCPGGSSAVIVTVQPATTYLTQATAAAVNPTVNILATPKYTDVAFPGAATRSKALFSLPVVIVVVLCGLMIL